MTNNSGTTKSATCSLDTTNKRVQLTIPANAYYNTSAKLYATYATVASKIGLTAAKIVKGNTILGIAGTAKAAAISQSGTLTVAVSPNSTSPYEIKFETAFANDSYNIIFTPTGTYKDYLTVSIDKKLASACKVKVKNSHTGSQATGKISWVAE